MNLRRLKILETINLHSTLQEMSAIPDALVDVRRKILQACERVDQDIKPEQPPRLVAVSKTKPKDLIIQAYECGQEHFGENYVQELVEKANDSEIRDKCKKIKWHFIGHLQKNNAKSLLTAPNLYIIETVHSQKLASYLDERWGKEKQTSGSGGGDRKLRVMVQANTSGEEAKHGCHPDEVPTLVEHIISKCPSLNFAGLMTIGALGAKVTESPNQDFLCLIKCRQEVCNKLNLNIQDVELSMGMSQDYEHAIELGSSNVRVGSTIFGGRQVKK